MGDGAAGDSPPERREGGRQRPLSARLRLGSWWRPSGAIAAICALLLGAAIAAELLVIRHLTRLPGPQFVPWIALAVMTALFVVTEVGAIHLYSGKETHSYNLGEASMVLGLLFLSPHGLVIARIGGAFIAFALYRRQRGIRLIFNLSNSALEACLAVAVYHAVLGHNDPFSVAGWIAGLSVAVVMDVTTGLAVSIVIALASGEVQRQPLRRLAGTLAVAALVNTSLGLMAGSVIWSNVRNIALVAVVAVIAVAAYRTYSALAQRYVNLELLYGFTKSVGRTVDTDRVISEMLTHAKEMMRAEVAELTLPADDGSGLRIVVGDDGQLQATTVALDTNGAFAANVFRTGAAMLAPRTTRDPADRRRLATRGFKDAVAIPLAGDTANAVTGSLLVANRLGNTSTFDHDDLRLLETIGAHAAVSLQNGRLVDQLREEVAEKEHRSMHDALTGLPNRALFHQRLAETIAECGANHTWGAVMLMDLDSFKEVNDTLGHHLGDLLLKEIAERLDRVLEGRGTIARLGGDEFAILLPSVLDQRDAMAVADGVLAELERPLMLNELNLEVGASIGMALYPAHGDDSTTLLQRADVAMYAAKANGGGRREVYASERDQYNPRRLALAGELRSAIDRGELVVHFQPTADLRTGRIIGAEALVRWAHPEHGLLMPDEFIPLTEHTGLIRPLTLEVLRQALGQCRRWEEAGTSVGVAVNLSARSLMDTDLPDNVAALLADTGVPPHLLTLELTESTIMVDASRTLGVLNRLAAMGVTLSIDDFGTGYSSLSYLKRLPVQEVKIDRSFVMNMTSDGNDAMIVRSTIDLARNLGLRVVAEGVEDEETWRRLDLLGCHAVQGYYISRPLPAGPITDLFNRLGKDVAAWIAANPNAPRYGMTSFSASGS